MRLFFSISPEPAVLLDIEQWRQQNWPLLEKPVPIANFHVTLAFLGQCSTDQLQHIEQQLTNYRMEEIAFRLDNVGYWPDTEILWLGSTRTLEAIDGLAQRCARIANKAGVRVSKRKFKPHLTLARRVKIPPTGALFTPEFDCVATELRLQRSFPDRNGVRYSVISSW